MEAGIFVCHGYFVLKAYIKKRQNRQTQPQDEEAKGQETQQGTGEATIADAQPDILLNPIFATVSHK